MERRYGFEIGRSSVGPGVSWDELDLLSADPRHTAERDQLNQPGNSDAASNEDCSSGGWRGACLAVRANRPDRRAGSVLCERATLLHSGIKRSLPAIQAGRVIAGIEWAHP